MLSPISDPVPQVSLSPRRVEKSGMAVGSDENLNSERVLEMPKEASLVGDGMYSGRVSRDTAHMWQYSVIQGHSPRCSCIMRETR